MDHPYKQMLPSRAYENLARALDDSSGETPFTPGDIMVVAVYLWKQNGRLIERVDALERKVIEVLERES